MPLCKHPGAVSWEPWSDSNKMVLSVLARPLNARRVGLTYWVSRRVLRAPTEDLCAIWGVMAVAGWLDTLDARFIVNNELDRDDLLLPQRVADVERFAKKHDNMRPVERFVAGCAYGELSGYGNGRAGGSCYSRWITTIGPSWPLTNVTAAR